MSSGREQRSRSCIPIGEGMYNPEDTIVAVSSADSGARVILRLSGSRAMEVCRAVFQPGQCEDRRRGEWDEVLTLDARAQLLCGTVSVDSELHVDGYLYSFFAPHSYTGQDVVEMHLLANRAVVQYLIERLLGMGLRMAEAGEFTARAYLNGKLDLSQAEAVNEIIVGSNSYQLSAAEKLLSGRLSQMTGQIRSGLLELLGLIEAGLDFSGEEIEFISRAEAVGRAERVRNELEQLLAGSITYEAVIDMPSVGIAGAPNAGKSSLLNSLLERKRSIVSHERKTTRDVLTGVLSLDHCDCVVFDCAGLVTDPHDVIDELAQEAALGALGHSSLMLFCVDASRGVGEVGGDLWREDMRLWSLVCGLGSAEIVAVASKCDLVSPEDLDGQLAVMGELFGVEFVAVSCENGIGMESLRMIIDRKLVNARASAEAGGQNHAAISDGTGGMVGLTARHRQVVGSAVENTGQAAEQLEIGNDELAALLLRAAYEDLGEVDRPGTGHVDEQILDEIFGRFCVGK